MATATGTSAATPTPGQPGRVVVAGGTGLIGRHLVPILHAAGHEVVVLSRRERGASPHARHQPWDPARPGPWQQSLSGADAVINLCGANIGAGRWSAARKRQLVESRTLPSRALVAACNRQDVAPAVLLQASGVNYYGTGDVARSEADPPGNDFLARLARDWEAPLADTDIRTVSLRFGVVLDRSGGALPQMLLPFRLFAGGPVAGGRQWLPWIHIEDAVAAIVFLMDSPLVDAVNVTAPQPLRNAEFADSAARALHRPARLPLPGWLLRLALGERATLLCEGVRALPAKLEAAEFPFAFPDLDRALADLIGP